MAMSDRTPPPAPRRSVSQTTMRLSAVAVASAAVVFAALFHGAQQKYAAATTPSPAQVAPTSGKHSPAPTATPVTTRTS